MKQTLFEGDLCVLDGYGNRIWEVVGFTFEKSSMSGKVTEEIIYNLSCIISTEWNIGVQSETMIVCKAAYAYQYVKELNNQGLPPSYNPEHKDILVSKKGGSRMNNEYVDIDEKELYIYPITIDGQLQKLSDLICQGEALKEVDEKLQLKIDKVKEVLSKLKQESGH